MKHRTLLLLLVTGCTISAVRAQSAAIYMLKLGLYQQSAGGSPTVFGFGFGTEVALTPPPSGTVTGTLVKPNGNETMTRDGPGTFSRIDVFLSKAAMDTRYPDGNYTIQLTGAVTANYAVTLNAATLPPAPNITNLAAAQSITNPSSFTLTWAPFTGATAQDFIGVTIESSDGSYTYSSADPGEPGALTGTATQITLNLPANRQFTAELTFLRPSQLTVVGPADIFAGGASSTQFSMRTMAAPGPGNAPVFGAHPAGRTVVVGDSATFSATLSGAGPFTYQWQHNNVDIPGATNATLTLPVVQSFQAGTYTLVVRNSAGVATSNGAFLTVAPLSTAGSNARLVNLATRGPVGTDAAALIPGFVLAGTGTKQVLIRAVGPSLTQFGLAANDVVADPTIALVSAGTGATVATNDDWQQATNAAAIAAAATTAGAFALPPGSRDAAILATLGPGGYTALVSGKGNDTGLAIVEVYDLDTAASGVRLVNIATRGLVGTESRVLIPGFVVSGTAPKTYLIRGIGPTLAIFGQSGALADPVLTVYQGATVLFSNDDWSSNSNTAEVTAAARDSGAFALAPGSRDAALLVTLRPGAYTFQVAGKGTATGVGLVEVYEVP